MANNFNEETPMEQEAVNEEEVQTKRYPSTMEQLRDLSNCIRELENNPPKVLASRIKKLDNIPGAQDPEIKEKIAKWEKDTSEQVCALWVLRARLQGKCLVEINKVIDDAKTPLMAAIKDLKEQLDQ